MNKIEKLLRKISKKERVELLGIVKDLINGSDKIKSIKIKNTNFFRVRHGQFRIIYHKEGGEVIVDNVRMRNENTYKGL